MLPTLLFSPQVDDIWFMNVTCVAFLGNGQPCYIEDAVSTSKRAIGTLEVAAAVASSCFGLLAVTFFVQIYKKVRVISTYGLQEIRILLCLIPPILLFSI